MTWPRSPRARDLSPTLHMSGMAPALPTSVGYAGPTFQHLGKLRLENVSRGSLRPPRRGEGPDCAAGTSHGHSWIPVATSSGVNISKQLPHDLPVFVGSQSQRPHHVQKGS